MLFDTVDYWLFFLIVVALFYSVRFSVGKWLLLAASYFFYMWWDPRFIALILASTVIDYSVGLLLGYSHSSGRRKLTLVASIVVNLGILGFFKYYNFFVASVASVVGWPEDSFALNIILPVGVSFYTFASLSYTIDVYWRKMEPITNFADYALFIAFFPHLIAGPIIRARQFLPQIANWRPPSSAQLQSAIGLVLSGLIKKIVFADHFALVSDSYFDHMSQYQGWATAASAILAFMCQIYFDFSGYTDIARGCARFLGFEFPLNFVRPLLATSIAQFWQRWHITLSIWVRDYLFKPLIRGSRSRLWIYSSLMLSMVLMGLWHGARWTFVLWGAYFGLLLVGYRVLDRLTGHTSSARLLNARWFTPLKVLFTFSCVVFGNMFFRSTSLTQSWTGLNALFNWHGDPGRLVLTSGTIALFFIALVLAVLEERHALLERLAFAPSYIRIPLYTCAFLSLELFSVPSQQIPFVYFQF